MWSADPLKSYRLLISTSKRSIVFDANNEPIGTQATKKRAKKE